MVNKRRLNYDYRQLKKIKVRYLLIIAFMFLGLGIYGLRQNYAQMVELRTAVNTADEQNGDVESALRELREFVHGHMNTDLSSGNVSIKPPVQLKYRYERLAKAEEKRIENINKQVKQRAEQICARQHPGAGFNSPRVECVAEYVRQNSIEPKPIPADLYKFDFVSPTWSPDLAGISLLLSLVFFSATIVRFAVGIWYKALLED